MTVSIRSVLQLPTLSLISFILLLCSDFLYAQTGTTFRNPSEIWKNVHVMRETTFKDYTEYINIEEDVQKYIRFELDKIVKNKSTFTGEEVYFFGLLFNEIGEHGKAVVQLKNCLIQPAKTFNNDMMVKIRTALTEAYIKIGKLESAALHLTVLESEKAPLTDLLFLEISKGYMKADDKKKSLLFAKKALSFIDPEMAGFFLDHIIAHFLVASMARNASTLVEDIISSMGDKGDEQTVDYIMNRKMQISLIGKPVPNLFQSKNNVWIGTSPPPTHDDLANNPLIVYFWASWCKPCLKIFRKLENLNEQYSLKGLKIVGITRYYKTVQGLHDSDKDPPLSKDEEIKLLNRYCEIVGTTFPTFIDEKHILGNSLYVMEIPHLLLIDRKGNVRFFRNGPTVELDLIDEVLADIIPTDNKRHK